jgi:hypothetical protein
MRGAARNARSYDRYYNRAYRDCMGRY